MFPKILLFGPGLIGGSLALAMKAAGLVEKVVSVDDHGRLSIYHAHILRIIDEIVPDVQTGLADTDLVILATPVGHTGHLLRTILPYLSPHTLITDVGSVKASVIEQAREILGEKIACFIPGHPIAGSEESGPEAARADLFQGKNTILCPLSENAPADLEKITCMWQRCGAQVQTLSAQVHDHIFGAVSHLPHILAFMFMDFVADHPDVASMRDHAGDGFYSFTRLASSSPTMWRDISLANRDVLVQHLDDYMKQLHAVRALIADQQSVALENRYRYAQRTRAYFLHRKSEKSTDQKR